MHSSLKIKNCRNANFVVTGNTAGCHYDNRQCYQSQQNWDQFGTLTSLIFLYPNMQSTMIGFNEQPLPGIHFTMFTNAFNGNSHML